MVTLWQKQIDYKENPLVYWRFEPDFSAQFYTKGKVTAGVESAIICKNINPLKPIYLVVTHKNLQSFQKSQLKADEIGKIKIGSNFDYLYKVSSIFCPRINGGTI